MSRAPEHPASRLAGPRPGCDDGPVTSAPTAVPDAALAPPPPVVRPAADRFVRRLLRIPDAGPRWREAELRSAFSRSILVSAVRCTLTYLVIPFLGPVIGLAAGVGPLVGIPIGALAIVFNVRSMRRFWAADHRYRWAYTAVGGTVVALLVVLIALDLVELVT